MFDPFTLALIGGGIGALTSRNPIKGAAMGAMGGYGIGSMPGLLGSMVPTQAAAPVADAVTKPVTNGLLSVATPTDIPGVDSGMLGGFKAANAYLKPIGDAAGSAGNIYGLYNMATQRRPEPQVQSSPVTQGGNGTMGLQNLVAQNQQADQMRQQAEMERRARRMAMFSGGGYGRFA